MAPRACQIGRSIKVALQGACACRGLTTSAARAQSSSKASIALEPANTAYEVRILPPNRVRIQGKLVGLFRRY